MADENVEALQDRLLTDPDHRARFVKDPAGVVREAGIELDEDQHKRLTDEGWADLEDDEVVVRIRTRGLAAWL
jgi:hypothetical protein